jgi:hypothetical protein
MRALPQISRLIADETASSLAAEATKSASAVSMIDTKLCQRGFTRISHMESHLSKKLTLSLVQRASIVLVESKTAGIQIRRGAMTVWSGRRNKSTKTYNASDCSYEFEQVVATW